MLSKLSMLDKLAIYGLIKVPVVTSNPEMAWFGSDTIILSTVYALWLIIPILSEKFDDKD